MHVSVLLREAVNALAVKPGGVYVDGTFGRGGHSKLILSRLGEDGSLVAFDKDLAAVTVGKQINDKRFYIRHGDFSLMCGMLQEMGINSVDGVLLDLGVSSPQLEEASRGFSFQSDGPLDMRMNTNLGQTASQWLASVSESCLMGVIRDYGEERFAKPIAKAIVMARARQPIVTTFQLAKIVKTVLHSRQRRRENKQHPATRTFQAIRIFINQELDSLSLVLPQCIKLLNSGGRLVIISFHSLEDRIVKRFMRVAANPDKLPRGLPLRDRDIKQRSHQTLRLIGKAMRPSEKEVTANPRAKSAVMRVAERV